MQRLEEWLSAATRGLSESAAARVRDEIGEHYLSATEAAQAVVDPLDVEREVVAALGDAKTANREYRRVLLTKDEAGLLSNMTSVRRKRWGAVISLAAVAVLLSGATGYTKSLIMTIVIEEVSRAISTASRRAGWIVRVVRWSVLALALIVGTMAAFHDMKGYVPGMAWWVLWAIYYEYKLFVIRRKLPVEQWPRRLWV